MKKVLFSLLIAISLLAACTKTASTVTETTASETAKTETTEAKVETTKAPGADDIIGTVNHMSEREFSFDPSIDFSYTGDDAYLKAITDEMVSAGKEHFGNQGAVEIPTPYIIKIDDSNKSDIKVYGNFYIYGYNMDGTIFNCKNGGSFPGCYHLKEKDGKVSFVSKEIAEDGSNNYSSLLKICGNDEELVKKIFAAVDNDKEKTRVEFVKMYANANKLRVYGIKDYGWPVILFNDAPDAEFVYNFYRAYFEEVRQDDSLNDMPERIERLKKKYITEDAIKSIDDMTMEVGADTVISAQDVTDEMMDTLQVDDFNNGDLRVRYNGGEPEPTYINIRLGRANGNKMIMGIYPVMRPVP